MEETPKHREMRRAQKNKGLGAHLEGGVPAINLVKAGFGNCDKETSPTRGQHRAKNKKPSSMVIKTHVKRAIKQAASVASLNSGGGKVLAGLTREARDEMVEKKRTWEGERLTDRQTSSAKRLYAAARYGEGRTSEPME